MDFFISGEIDSSQCETLGRDFIRIGKIVEKKLNDNLKDKSYGDAINDIGIIPVIINFDNEMDPEVWFKERKLFQRKDKAADYRLRIDYNKFINGSDEIRQNLLLRNIIDSIRDIGRKAKKNFLSVKLEKDILDLFNKEYKDL